MTTTTGYNGRLGNQIIRNLAVSLIAEKNDLHVYYYNDYLIKRLGIHLFNGSKIYEKTYPLNDNNYFSLYNEKSISYNLDPNQSYFQTKEIIQVLYNYLHKDEIKSMIIENNLYKDRYKNNHDLFIHIRLTDVAHFNPGIHYYLNAIQKVTFENLYISTDDKHHEIIQQIVNLYPNSYMIDMDELNTIQFATTNENIILSHGSFSAIIGYLSFFSTIYYPEYETNKMWYGDMFSIPNWNKLPVL